MKKSVLLLMVLFAALVVKGQTGMLAAEDKSCYTLWAKAFESRGANDVTDGVHEGVILSIRYGSKNECYTAKVKIEKGEVKEIFRKFVGGVYEEYKPKYKYEDQKIGITNGISRTMQTKDDELINVIFIKNLKPKKEAYEKAPLPTPDDF